MPALKWLRSCPPVSLLECMEAGRAGPRFLWSRGPSHPSCTSPYPQHTRRGESRAGRVPHGALCTLPAACCCPETSSRSRGQQWWKKPEVTKMSRFRYLIFGSGQSRNNRILFSCYFLPMWCSQCCFHPIYLFLQQAIAPIIHPNWLLETKQWMSMTLARGIPLQKPLSHVCDKQHYGRKENFKAILPSLTIKSDSLVATVILIIQVFVSSKQGLSSKLIYVKIN